MVALSGGGESCSKKSLVPILVDRSKRKLAQNAPNRLDVSSKPPHILPLIPRPGGAEIDPSGFNGWENIAAFENHAGFVKNHQQKVERIAVIAGHDWQHWLIGAVRLFLHPEVRAYDRNHESEALKWIVR